MAPYWIAAVFRVAVHPQPFMRQRVTHSLSFAWRFTSSACSLVLLLVALAATPSLLAAEPAGVPGIDSPFYKIGVAQTGMVSLSYAALSAAGVPVGSLDPTTFRLYEHGAEVSRIVVDADSSGSFNSGDYLLFYGRKVDTEFTGTNIYWLTYGGDGGLDMTERSAAPAGGQTPVTTFVETAHFEQNVIWKSDAPMTGVTDRWYWQYYAPSCDVYGNNCVPNTLSFPFSISGVAGGSHTALLAPRLRGYADRAHHSELSLNSHAAGAADFNLRSEFTGTLAFDQTWLIDGSNTLTLTTALDASFTNDTYYVNWFELSYDRTYAAPASGQFAFGIDAAFAAQATITGVVDSASLIFDITDPTHPVRLTGIASAANPVSGFDLTLGHATGGPGRYLAAAISQYLSPTTISLDTPSNLHNPASGADWIAISHASFISAAQTLSSHRQSYQGLRTAVVELQDVYDEFNGGLPDQEAVREFIRYAYENWPGAAPRFVVLFGDGNYDPRNYRGTSSTSYFPPYLAAVDPFEGMTAADNRYAALDPVAPAINPAPFIHIGRLPANTLADAQGMVTKLIAYDTAPSDPNWNRRVTFVTDNPDYAGEFYVNSNAVADDPAYLPAEIARTKIYFATGDSVATTTTAIVNAINSGTLLLNYNGHGSWRSWASEGLWQTSTLTRLTNAGKYPVILAMSCLEGYFISPLTTMQSLGESVVRLSNAGAVASWSPTGKGVATGHDVIFRGFYEAVFSAGMEEIGAATDYAKQQLYESTSLFKDLIDTYVLFGDPATRLRTASPDLSIDLTASPPGSWLPGQTVTYLIAYGNEGPASAAGVVLTQTLPSQITAASWLGSSPSVTLLSGPSGGSFVWQLPDLAPGASGTISVSVTLQSSLGTGATVSSVGSITTASWESLGDRSDNTDQLDRPVASPTALQVNMFEAIRDPLRVRVYWETLDEANVFGFAVLSSSPGEAIRVIRVPFVPSVGRESGGASYTATVDQPSEAGPISLWLLVLHDDGRESLFGPITATTAWQSYMPLFLRH